MTFAQARRALPAIACAVLAVMVVGCFGGSTNGTSRAAKRAAAERLYDRGRFDAAIAALEEIVAKDPGDVGSRKTLALALAAKGDVKKAIAQYRSILERSPKDHESMYRMAQLLRLDGDAAAAVDLLREAIRIAPDRAAYREELAKSLGAARRFEEAAKVWRELLDRPDLGRETVKSYFLGLVDAYLGAGDTDAARAALVDALERVPGDPELLARQEAIR